MHFFYKLKTIYQSSLDFTHKQTRKPPLPSLLQTQANISVHFLIALWGIFLHFVPIRDLGLDNAIVSTHACACGARNMRPQTQMSVVYTGCKV